MVQSDLQGGTLTIDNQDYPATISNFTVQQILRADGGGFTPSTMATAKIARADFPTTSDGATIFPLHTGQNITATPSIGPARACRLESYDDMGALLQLTLRDVNQGA